MKSPHLDREWLHQKYIVEGLSTYDIGKLVSRDPKRIYEKLIDFGIPTRQRGHNLKGGDNYIAVTGLNPFQGRHHSAATKAVLSQQHSKPAPHLRGAANGMHGRTGKANPHYIDGSSPERQRLYAAGDWKALLRFVYKRDGYKCARCGAGKAGPRSIHAHHIKAWAGNQALRFDPANLITLCRTCHEWVHSRQNTSGMFLA